MPYNSFVLFADMVCFDIDLEACNKQVLVWRYMFVVGRKEMSKTLILGMLAHVDAGKTTLTEGLLYTSGMLRKVGRVDKGDAFLDTFEMEKQRGITIFSKQALLHTDAFDIMLMDTPGHVDFAPEMERILQVLDAAVLVISAADGIQAHTRTLWRLLQQYDIPVILFINKMDQQGSDRDKLMQELKEAFGDGCVDVMQSASFQEEAAMCDERALNVFLETGTLPTSILQEMILERRLFPCYFGSALKLEGILELLNGIQQYLPAPLYPQDFGARVYKIARDVQGVRLTYLKITGGTLCVRQLLETGAAGEQEKVSQIRLYSGEKYETLSEAHAGMVVAVTGLEHSFAGQGLGVEKETVLPLLEPVLSYRLILPQGADAAQVLPKIRQLSEEEPALSVAWDEEHKEIHLKLMGEVQLEILQQLIKERFGLEVSFGPGNIVYKETIADTVEGVGHFEPLRHYAEVHLLLEPGERGSGMQFASACSEDILDRNWQRLILTHLREREHRGILTGSALTDVRITLVSGRAHKKHTEGGDFRQATYRAVRQGLKQAQSILLEPYNTFELAVPENMIGRAMTDLERLFRTTSQPELREGMAYFRGNGPVACLQNYQKEVTAYTRGLGALSCALSGYGICHNAKEVIEAKGYDCERDVRNPSDSVFCAHGAGFLVPWDEVPDYMHLPSILSPSKGKEAEERRQMRRRESGQEELTIGTEEIDEILRRTAYANQKDDFLPHKGISAKRQKSRTAVPKVQGAQIRRYQQQKTEGEYLLVDGYNIIFAWEELRELARENLDSARGRLLDILCNYQGIRGCELIAVFDAYRLEGHAEEAFSYHNIHVVFTREAETADGYIERFAHENGKKYRISVATSDGLEQIIIRGAGCILISARELEAEIKRAGSESLTQYQERQEKGKIFLSDAFPHLD